MGFEPTTFGSGGLRINFNALILAGLRALSWAWTAPRISLPASRLQLVYASFTSAGYGASRLPELAGPGLGIAISEALSQGAPRRS